MTVTAHTDIYSKKIKEASRMPQPGKAIISKH